MPNHVTNRLIMFGSSEKVNEVIDFLNGEDEEGRMLVDFRNITPPPKWLFTGNLGREDELKYGTENCWYDWNLKNWGTKWNSYDNRKVGDNELWFDTAWSNVADLMFKLSFMFPEVQFEYSWADEDTGNNAGKFIFKDAERISFERFINGSKKAYDMCFELKNDGVPYPYYKFNEQTETYEYDEEYED